MKTFSLISSVLVLLAGIVSCSEEVQYEWAPSTDRIMTRWASDVNPSNSHPEYPRPQMVRSDWQSLNGLWEYAITPLSQMQMPDSVDGAILVPFAVESALSGVGRTVTDQDALWYKTSFSVPKAWKGKKVILHFDGVDWKSEVEINGTSLPVHTGAYTAFEYDITPYLKKNNTVILKVSDATDKGDFQPRGKQVSEPSGIWYTAVTGIWKSVWIEPVSDSFVSDYYAVSDIDAGTLTVDVKAENVEDGDIVRVELLDGAVGYSTASPSDKVVACAESGAASCTSLVMNVPDANLWSPENPYLYGMKISIVRDGVPVDEVQAYTAMRKVSKIQDKDGYWRIALNNKAVFNYGPLDQGWWPDGLYTAPTDEAMRFDLIQTKEHGFNMIRKHIKVEPFTWFYACDQLGIMVWQDMPSFAVSNKWERKTYAKPEYDFPATDAAKANYYKEWGEIISQVKKFQSIVVWVPFNEAWSQFDTQRGVEFTYEQDDTRLVNMASGGNWFEGLGDILDSHNYPQPDFRVFDKNMINVVGEYGGIGLPLQGHLWTDDKNWGYVQYQNGSEVTDAYVEYASMMKDLAVKGCAAAVYTQTTDVEIEVNGLMTYDREVIKMDVARVREANEGVIKSVEE